MPKNKRKKFAEMAHFKNVFQPPVLDIMSNDFVLKGYWNEKFFKNNNNITLELACGRGEYSIALARKFPNRNFIGIDFKGARLYQGAKIALDEGLHNVAFVRTRIEFVHRFFKENEIEEIWIIYPDPQPKKERKRLTSPRFLKLFGQIMKPNSLIHLKTDNEELFDYTLEIIQKQNCRTVFATRDLYQSEMKYKDIAMVKTYYETLFENAGQRAKYICFSLQNGHNKNARKEETKGFYEKVYEIVKKVPYGRVTSYGAIAEYLGSKGAARMVGYALNISHSLPENIPAHRVVNRIGMLTGKQHFGGAEVMKQLLENEGLEVDDNTVKNFDHVFWSPCQEL